MSELRLIDVKNLLKDYGLPNLETLEYVLQQYQILINELSHNKFSKLTTAAKYIIDKVNAESVKHGPWISTKEKMPEKDTSVLICACGHRVTAYYDHLKKAFILTEDENLYYKLSAVTHWMPLPEVPQMDGGANDERT